MNVVDKATETQLNNIQARTGKSLDELYGLVRESGLTKHGEIRDMLKEKLGLGHGDANTLATMYGRSQAPAPAPEADPLEAIYTGAKAPLRPLHEKVLAGIAAFGPFEVAPKKGYVSLRRKKQFAMVGPGSRGRLEVGLNLRAAEPSPRLAAEPPGGMCQYKVHLANPSEVDAELLGWLRAAYDAAG